MGLINSNKNKLNSKISWQKISYPNEYVIYKIYGNFALILYTLILLKKNLYTLIIVIYKENKSNIISKLKKKMQNLWFIIGLQDQTSREDF